MTWISLGIHPVWSAFTVCMKKGWVFSYPQSAQRRLWSDYKTILVYRVAAKYKQQHAKTNKMSVRPAKTQISLGICPVWSEASLLAWKKLGSLATHCVHSEDSDQTSRMPRLIWVFAGHTHFVRFVMSWLISLSLTLQTIGCNSPACCRWSRPLTEANLCVTCTQTTDTTVLVPTVVKQDLAGAFCYLSHRHFTRL